LFALIVLWPLATRLLVADARAQTTSPRLRVATTTSLYDTGLWDALEAAFEAETAIPLDIIYAGTGRALEWGMHGDVDVVVTHSPSQEAAFVAGEHGVERIPFAYNHFLIAGPAADPAHLANLAPEAAMQILHAAGRFPFVSRGDDSGTHTREKALWRAAGLDPAAVRASGRWYVEAGLGMGPTLSMAAQLGAYTLTDVGTFLAYRHDLDLVPIVDRGDALRNVYAVIVCTRAANRAGADRLAAFLCSTGGQELIGEFGREKYGRPLFTPCAAAGCGSD
jgi:tungstate transport system substrate-binding protein